MGAGVSVKLVSSIGIGTVACGVAKANADVIQISGGDGGTGASPLSSIKHAGGPWELGLSEAHAALMNSNLRDRVTIRVDGGVRTGRDVVIGAMLGAEEFGFGTIAMISEEIRNLLAHLGYTRLEDLIGRADLLRESRKQKNRVAKTKGIELGPYFSGMPNTELDRSFFKTTNEEGEVCEKGDIVHRNGGSSDLDRELINNSDVQNVISENTGEALVEHNIKNTDRSVCAMLAGDIARAHGSKGFKGVIKATFRGSAGQSFGAFVLPGLNVRLIGEANDYVGKGMHGGEIVVVPDEKASFVASESSIVGNACLYGSTGGEFYANGRAGERFCVRNSGVKAVVEGTGDHVCEYMTGGVVVVLGTVGRNVGAGMTGGIGYFYDPDNSFEQQVNGEIVKVQRVKTTDGNLQLKTMIESHFEKTGSEKAEKILANWDEEVSRFWQIYPPSEAESPFVKSTELFDEMNAIKQAPDGKACFLPVGGELNEEQTSRCAD